MKLPHLDLITPRSLANELCRPLLGASLCLTVACHGPVQAPAIPPLPIAGGSGSAAEYAWPTADWWHTLGQPELQRLIETALEANPGIQVSAARIQQAEGLTMQMGAAYRPELSARGSLTAERFSADFIQNKLAGESFGALVFSPLTLRYHLDFWGRDQAALAAAVQTQQARNAELAQARMLLSTAVVRAFIRLAYTESRLALVRESGRLQRKMVDLMGVRRRLGLDARQTSRLAEIKLSNVQQRIQQIDAEMDVLRHQIAALAGKGSDWTQNLHGRPLTLDRQTLLPNVLPLSLLARRADVVAARKLAEAAAQEVRLARTQFYPDINLIGFAGFQSVSLTDLLFMGRNAAFSIGPSLELPLFDAGRLKGNLTQKQAAFDAAVSSYDAAVVRAVQDTADALTRRRETTARLVQQKQAVSASHEHVRLTEALHRTGLNSGLQVLESRLNALEQDYLSSLVQAEAEITAVNLIEALGGGYQSETPVERPQ